MQIQAPRNVLGETSIDMWALSYADPETAKAVFLGQFLDAVVPNIPCMREDGEMNMVAADGSECGTSISWCFPYFCAASIFDRTHDKEWLRQLYPGLASLLKWTLANRTDAGGFLVGKCSWETGMDTSKRFLIQQPTGGETVEFLRLVELQAAAAQAGEILARFAQVLDENAAPWEQVRADYKKKTQELWQGEWFHDFDTRSMQLVTTTQPDPSQAAPAFCGVATEEQKRRLLPTLHKMLDGMCAGSVTKEEDGSYALNWSSFMLPYLESAWAAGDFNLAARATESTAQRIYTTMDRREVHGRDEKNIYSGLGWPGVSCEVWGCRGSFGGEGYGWGAVLPAHIIRTLMGFRETATQGEFTLCPNLTPALVEAGKEYAIHGLRYGKGRFNLTVQVLDGQRVRIDIESLEGIQVQAIRSGSAAVPFKQVAGARWQWEANLRTSYSVRLA
jgi:hypothetical protein